MELEFLLHNVFLELLPLMSFLQQMWYGLLSDTHSGLLMVLIEAGFAVPDVASITFLLKVLDKLRKGWKYITSLKIKADEHHIIILWKEFLLNIILIKLYKNQETSGVLVLKQDPTSLLLRLPWDQVN